MTDRAHLYHGAHIRRMVEAGWFSEPAKSELSDAARRALEASRTPDTQIWRERFIEQEGFDPIHAALRGDDD